MFLILRIGLNLKTRKMKQVKSILILSAILFVVFACNKDDDDNDNNTEDTGSIYYQEFDVDTTNYANDTVFYDVDNDGAFEIEVTRTIEIENSEAQYGGQFRWVNEPIDFCFMVNTPSTSMIEFGDEINGNANFFEWQPVINCSGSVGVLNENHYWPQVVFTEYFGFKYMSNQGTIYGWFRFKHFELAEMAINTNPNEPILVGQKE